MDDDGPIDRLLSDDEDGQPTTSAGGPDSERASGEGADPGPAGPDEGPLEPESVSTEHAAFVLVGAALTLIVIVSAL